MLNAEKTVWLSSKLWYSPNLEQVQKIALSNPYEVSFLFTNSYGRKNNNFFI